MATKNGKKTSRGKIILRVVLIVLAIVIAGGIGVHFLQARRAVKEAMSAVTVQTACAETGTITQTIDGSGNLEAAEIQGVMVPVGVKIDEVQVQTGDTVKQGDVLATVNTASVAGAIAEVDDSLQAVKNTLNESGHSSYEREELTARRDELQAVRDELVILHDNPVITATTDGIIGGVGVSDGEEITTATSASSSSTSSTAGTSLSAVSAAGMSYTGSKPLVATSLSAGDSQQEPEASAEADTPVTDYSALNDSIKAPAAGEAVTACPIDAETFSGQFIWVTADEVFQPATAYTAEVELTANEGYVFTADGLAALKLAYEQQGMTLDYDAEHLDTTGHTLQFILTFPLTAGDPTPEASPSAAPADSTPEASPSAAPADSTPEVSPSDMPADVTPSPEASAASDDIDLSSLLGSSGYSSGSGTSYSAVSSVTGKTVSDTYNTHEAEVFTIILTDNVKLNINVDELDILQVKEGQEVIVTIDAADGAEFEGKIDKVSVTASGNTGNTKYTAEILIPMDDNMRIGMSATAKVIIGEADDVVTLPMAALQESDGETFVYTSVDEDGVPGTPVTVIIGASDGTTAEIQSGLNVGDTVYYTRAMTADEDYYSYF